MSIFLVRCYLYICFGFSWEGSYCEAINLLRRGKLPPLRQSIQVYHIRKWLGGKK